MCAACGAENREGARFCDTCGAALHETPTVREQRKTVSVLFCDVTGSTALGERLDPESLRRVLARYFEIASAAVERHGGTVEKFIGDAVMAVFGVPVVHEDDALRAVRAAAEIREALETLNAELERDFGTTLSIRFGVTTGEVVTGTEERLATGDAVNVAARLEQAAEPGDILLGDETVRLLRDAVDVAAVEPLTLKGKRDAVPAFRLVSVDTAWPRRRLDAVIVGRERELRLLADAWERVRTERSCHLFTVMGAAGVGKSRVVVELLGSLTGARVLRGRCLPYGEGITYWPVVEVLKQLTDLDAFELDPRARSALRSVLGDDEVSASTDEIAWAVRKALEAAAATEPLVCVFDDVHWGEQTFLDLVEHVADLSRDAPILLLCMARPELLDRKPGWAGGKLNATTVLLEPLSAAETDALIDGLLGGADVDGALRERIRERAEGNPLFVEEMLGMLRGAANEHVDVPPTIQALLAARIDQLDPAERGVLERGSGDRPIPFVGIVRATSLAMLGRFEEARACSEDERRRYEELGDRVHYALALCNRGLLERLAGEWEAAHAFLENGCDLLDAMGEQGFLSTFVIFRGQAAYELGDLDEASACALKGRSIGAADDIVTQMLWRQVHGKVLARRGEHDEAIRLAREAVRLGEPTDSLEPRADAHCDLAEVLELAGRPAEAAGELARALELYERKGIVVSAARVRERLADLGAGAA